jgi:glycosyltransferase involved in cell wall biosynthesis
MNVLILAQYFPPDLGGSATRACNMAKGLRLNGCGVTVIAAFPHYPNGEVPAQYRWRPFKVEWVDGVRVIRTFMFPLESKGLAKRLILFAAFAVSSLFASPWVGKVDVVWAANPDIVALVPALVYGAVKRRPVTANVDDVVIEDLYDLRLVKRGSLLARLIEFVARYCYGRMALVTPISPGYVRPIADRYGVAQNKVRVVPGGVDLSLFTPKPSQEGSEPHGKFTVLYSGAFSMAYDFDQVLRAAQIVGQTERDVRFILQGKGELVDYLKSRVKELGLGNVKVLDKLLRREEVGELLQQADILIQPLGDYGKPHMGVSTKLYEYQAVGKPIICCSSGIPGEYVAKTRSGIVIKPGDSTMLAEAVLKLKRSPQQALSMGRRGRMYVEDTVALEAVGYALKRAFSCIHRLSQTRVEQ